MKNTKNKIVCLVGESGSGKTTLYEALRKKGHKVVDSYTTRAPRKLNELGHTFITQDDFDAIRASLVAYTKFDEFEYGTTFEQLEDSEFYIIDPAGIEVLSDKIGRENFIVVNIFCSELSRYERLEKERGESHATQRIHHDKFKFRNYIQNKDWDYVLHNEFKEQLNSNVQQLIDWYNEHNSGV